MARFFKSRFFGTGTTAGGGGTPPASPTLAIADAGNGTGGTATISGATPGTSNTVYSQLWDGIGSGAWVARGTRSGNGTVVLSPAPAPGRYWWHVLSTDAGGAAISNLVYARITNAAAPGLLTGPKEALRAILAESSELQLWLGAPTLAECHARIVTSYLEDEDIFRRLPLCVVDWDSFGMQEIAGGDRNYLWPQECTLSVTIAERDPHPQDPISGDQYFQRRLETVLEEIAELAGADDRLAISNLRLAQGPTRNPRADRDAAGAYIWGSFTVSYD